MSARAPYVNRSPPSNVGRIAGWVFVLSPELDLFGIQLPSHYVGVPTLYLIGVGAALLTSVFAGLYPSVKAAQLEPLETLRLG